jgi:acetyl-CoA carboxylase biotin carboxylase subunit
MFDTVLIANRGEIALRIVRACKALGLKSVAVFSEADSELRHIALADQALCIGPAPSSKSYLNKSELILAARLTQAGAIHPGYGFLSENAEFAEMVENAGLTFIGPGSAAIKRMGDKVSAKRAMTESGVPVYRALKAHCQRTRPLWRPWQRLWDTRLSSKRLVVGAAVGCESCEPQPTCTMPSR